MINPELDEIELEFLISLHELAQGDPHAAVDMYQVGFDLDLDREQARRIGEELIGFGYLEVRSLSGAVGLTPKGLQTAGAAYPGLAGSGAREMEVIRVPDLSAEIKILTGDQVGGLTGLLDSVEPALRSPETPAEALADLISLRAQLASPQPKAGIVAEALVSLYRFIGDGVKAECRKLIEEVKPTPGEPR